MRRSDGLSKLLSLRSAISGRARYVTGLSLLLICVAVYVSFRIYKATTVHRLDDVPTYERAFTVDADAPGAPKIWFSRGSQSFEGPTPHPMTRIVHVRMPKNGLFGGISLTVPPTMNLGEPYLVKAMGDISTLGTYSPNSRWGIELKADDDRAYKTRLNDEPSFGPPFYSWVVTPLKPGNQKLVFRARQAAELLQGRLDPIPISEITVYVE